MQFICIVYLRILHGTSVNYDSQMNANVSQGFYLLAIVLVASLPAVSLIFVVQCAALKRCIKRQRLQPTTAAIRAYNNNTFMT